MSSAASDTLGLLEQRLGRLEFQLGVQPEEKHSNGNAIEPVAAHLERLQSRFKELCAKNTQAAEVLRLYGRNSEVATLLEKQHHGDSVQAEEKEAAHVLAASALFPQIISDLNNLQGQHVPDAHQIAALVGLQPRIVRALAVQRLQSQQANELQLRSAQLLSRWYQRSVLGEGEQWVACEDRLSRMETQIRRREYVFRREEEGL